MLNKSMFTSGNNEYCTPKNILKKFGPFDLDLCCTEENKVCEHGCHDMDLLDTRKYYGVVWCNPPYSTVLQNKAIDICIRLARRGNHVFLLIPCRMNSKRFEKLLKSLLVTRIHFPNERLKFNGSSAPFDAMIVELCSDIDLFPTIQILDMKNL